MKILVTGGAGFIGSNFIHYWMREHPADSIINLDKLTYAGNLENLESIDKNPNYEFHKFDITCRRNGAYNDMDFQKLVELVKKCDVVVHYAAESHVDRSIASAQEFVMTNVVGTQLLLEAALAAGKKRFHHVSTDEVFGQLALEDNTKFTETTRYNPRNPYSASKASSDHFVRAYCHTHGLPITITNTENNYGPYQYPEKLLPLAITNLLEGKKVPIYGDGKYIRDWLYVDDHCRAIDLILEKGKIGETYCIGGLTEDVNNLELIQKVLEVMNKDDNSLEFVKDRPGHDRRYAVDWTKAKNELGYVPKHSLDEYLEKTVQWYEDNEAWWKRIKSGEYLEYYKKQYVER
ncbi:dTDP-glucose 4,6-dehydratase [Patescibacteria group bacterium]